MWRAGLARVLVGKHQHRVNHAAVALWLACAVLAGCASAQTEPASGAAPAGQSAAPDHALPAGAPGTEDDAGASHSGAAKPGRSTGASAANPVQPAALRVGGGNDDGVVVLSPRAALRAAAPIQVSPTELDVQALPLAMLPEPLEAKDAPESLPHSIRNADEVTVRESSGISASQQERSVYVVVDKELGRMQIGQISANQQTGRQVYRRCGTDRPQITPARWMTLSRKAGEIVLQVSDAWFDHRDCKMAVMRDTYVKPMPLLGGLWWAFRTRCDSCAQKDWLVVLAPHLLNITSSGMGMQPSVTNGALSILRMPLRRGGSAAMSAQIQPHSVKQWQQALETTLPKVDTGQIVQVGMELTQTVSDATPTAIVFATVASNRPAPVQFRSRRF